jgi:hypothetical protein
MQIPTNFTVSPSSQQGDVYGTEFTFTAQLPSEYNVFAWSFGDNVIEYNKNSVTHTYNYPGIYTIGLSAWTDYGLIYTDKATVNVDYVYRDAITFSHIPSTYGIPGLKSSEPFIVSLTSAKIDQPLSIVFQSFNTNSVPRYAVPDKWNFITPNWRFVDASTNQILNGAIPISSIPIYKDSKIVAVKGEAAFYYIDDLSTGLDPNNDCPLLLAATLSTERFSYPPESLIYPYASYSNSEITRAVIAWQINDVVPTKLKVTENFLSDVYPIKWSNVPIPVMITCEFDTAQLSSFDNAASSTTTVLSYPKSNEIGALHNVVLTLSSDVYGVLTSGIHFTASDDLYFKTTDEYNNISSGYIFTTITPLSVINSTIVVTASTVASNQLNGSLNSFSFPVGYPIYPEIYISHPKKNTINKINIVTYPKDCDNINYYKNLGTLIEGTASFITVPALTSTDLVNYTLSGTSNVYGMAFNPIKNRLYTCDADQNFLTSYSSGTTQLTSIQLSSISLSEILAPSYISIDEYSNIWVSLFDDHKLLKFDSDLNYLLSAAPSLSGGPTEAYFLSPPVVETDMDSNIWACYSAPLSSILVKFDSNGTELFQASALPTNSSPVSLAINNTNGVWVACKNTNNLMHYTSGGTLVETASGFLKPSYIAVDRSNNVWVAHGYDLCSVYNTTTSTISTWRVSTKPQQITSIVGYTSADEAKAYETDEIWGGLAVDVYDRVWVIDSVNNATAVFGTTDPTNFRVFDVIPSVDTNYVILPNTNYVSNLPSDNVRSAQAGGDWTGNRWYQKYSGAYNFIPIEGKSTPFRLYDIDNSYQISKVNEEFDCANYFKSLALPEILSQNTTLFDKFFAAVVGDGNPTKESAGRVIYERIANFVSNHSDFETAEIDALLSIAKEMAVDTKTFGDEFPTAINRLLNIFSVPKNQLRGVPNLETDVMNNIGAVLTEASLVTANKYYFVKDKRYDTYQLIYANTVNGFTTYPLLSVDIEGFRTPIVDNYHFFEYNEQNSNGYVGNLINWDSLFTTVPYTLSTNEEWYGDGGLVETMFNNLLTKQLYEQ